MITKAITIWCDGVDCFQFAMAREGAGEKAARSEVRGLGWYCEPLLHLCPVCREKNPATKKKGPQ